MLERDLDIAITHQARKLLSPLYQQDTLLGEKVVESQRLQLPGRVYAIQVDVVEIRCGAAVLVHQCEGRTGDVLLGGGFESGRNSLDERGLARPQLAAQQ